jgi:hypothetical protein
MSAVMTRDRMQESVYTSAECTGIKTAFGNGFTQTMVSLCICRTVDFGPWFSVEQWSDASREPTLGELAQ